MGPSSSSSFSLKIRTKTGRLRELTGFLSSVQKQKERGRRLVILFGGAMATVVGTGTVGGLIELDWIGFACGGAPLRRFSGIGDVDRIWEGVDYRRP